MTSIHVLLSNDDGIDAFGLCALESALADLPGFRTTTVAPATQQSATSRCMTLNRPLRVQARGPGRWAVNGTPTDTVMVALGKILREDPPDIVLAGINHGPNLGEDVHYSGTVAAAMEGCIQGFAAAAISLADWRPTDFGAAAAFIYRVLPELVARPLPIGTMWNINVPNGPESILKGMRITRQGSRTYHDVINDMVDPRGKPMVWISGKGPHWIENDETDYAAVRDGYVSMTPLMIDQTNHDAWRRFSRELSQIVPGRPATFGNGDRFVMRPDPGMGLTIDGPTRGANLSTTSGAGFLNPSGGMPEAFTSTTADPGVDGAARS